MATFVHNEPTSLVIIQEAGLPEVFYSAIEVGLEPAIEACASSKILYISYSHAGYPSHSKRYRRFVS